MARRKSKQEAALPQKSAPALMTPAIASPDASPAPPLRLEWIEAGSLSDNPENWRRHPDEQKHTLRDVIRDPEIGWAGACLYNEATGHFLDGHLRKAVADPNEKIPVLIGRWSEAAERKILATLDPLAAMALGDAKQFDALAATIEADSLWLRNLIENTARGCDAATDDDTPAAEKTAGAPHLAAMSCNPFEHYDYVVLLFKSTLDFSRACDVLGIKKLELCYPGGLTKIGLGRCIPGPPVIDRLTNAAAPQLPAMPELPQLPELPAL